MDLERALEQFDATDANVRRLEQIWGEMASIVPSGIAFIGGGPEDERYAELRWAYDEIVAALPAISGYQITAEPMALNEIAQGRLDASDIGEIEIGVRLLEDMERPGREIHQYRFLLDRERRRLVRNHAGAIGAAIDRLLDGLTGRFERGTAKVIDDAWTELVQSFDQLERIAGSLVPRTAAWDTLRRHLRFGQGQDLHDIADKDWPAVRAELQQNLYSELEPIPVEVQDLGSLVASGPSGPVTTAMNWGVLSAEQFERLLFNLIVDAGGYENPQWLTATNAPDRGRDLSVDRIRADALSGSVRERVIVQAKHWLTNSVSVDDVAANVAQMALWEPPPVHGLVIATSGRFTTDAVDWIERHNNRDARPRIEMWAHTHLELLLARRPDIAAAAGLHRAPAG